MASTADSAVGSFIEEVMRCYNVPGVSLTVVHKGHVRICQGFGATDLTSNVAVHERTKFCVGSITKGFTSALLATLLPQHGHNWRTPLKKIFKSSEFKLPDPYMTENATLKDLMAHKMGIELGETDFGWLCSSFQRDELYKIVRHLPLSSTGFRVSMIYNNFLSALGGQVAEKLTGCRWEELIKERFFQLLGMDDANFIDEQPGDTGNIAKPHLLVKGELKEVSLDIHRGGMCVGPAATICASARDMSLWMLFLLSEGRLGDLPIMPRGALAETWRPQMALPCGKPEWDGYASQPTFPVTESRDTYGLSWYRGSYRGYQMVAHSGEFVGYDSLLTLYPDLQLGIYTSFNGPGGEHAYIGNQLIHYYITDKLLGLDEWLTPAHVKNFPEPWLPRERYFIPKVHTDIIRGISSTRPLTSYVGTYKHGFLGDININVDNDRALLRMYLGKTGEFVLHPNGELDEFRLEGSGLLWFLHQWDNYAPTDWMMIKFCSMETDAVDSCIVSLFESGPVFKKVHMDIIM